LSYRGSCVQSVQLQLSHVCSKCRPVLSRTFEICERCCFARYGRSRAGGSRVVCPRRSSWILANRAAGE